MSLKSKKLKDLIIVVALFLSFVQLTKILGANKKRIESPVLSSSSILYEKATIKYIPYHDNLATYELIKSQRKIQWSDYAYVQYATDWDYLCGCIINFIDLRRMGSNADLVLLISDEIEFDENSSQTRLFHQNVLKNNIKFNSVHPLRFKSESTTWDKSFTKFHAFELIQYKRVIYFDSDARILRPMDELFFLPDCKIAMPAAYDSIASFYKTKNYDIRESLKIRTTDEKLQINQNIELLFKEGKDFPEILLTLYNSSPGLTITEGFTFENQIMVIRPSINEYQKLIKLTKRKSKNEYDMDIINKLYNVDVILNRQIPIEHEFLNTIPDVLIISHQKYGFLTGELRKSDHTVVLSEPQDLPFVISNKLPPASISKGYWSDSQTDKMLNDVSLAHFSDYPISKPWYAQKLPNDFAQYKVVGRTDVERMQEYKEYNLKQTDVEDHIMPTIIEDEYLAEQWNQFYENYIRDRRNMCGLEPIQSDL